MCLFYLLDNSSPLMSDLYNWLSPVKELVAGEGVAKVIVSMVNIVKEKIPSISCNKAATSLARPASPSNYGHQTPPSIHHTSQGGQRWVIATKPDPSGVLFSFFLFS